MTAAEEAVAAYDADGAPAAPQPGGAVPEGTSVAVGAAEADNPLVADIVARARGLHRPDGGVPDGRVFGDHILNPHLPPLEAPPRAAAVLLALGRGVDGRPAIVLTERAANLSRHAGQIALPGGKIEVGETPAAAALREAEEETALPVAAVAALGLVEPYLTRTGFSVVPVLGLVMRPVRLVPYPGEVAAVFTAAWDDVMQPERHREIVMERNGVTRRFHEVMSGERRIWGVTAGILRLVHERLYR
jgi:8-oxo-dGTP pyrophosphatase MutT (NUDIX family)